jgi:uroporphyrinogen decarboxylase
MRDTTQSSQQRVRRFLSGSSSDRPIVDIGGRVASLHKSVYPGLKNLLGFGSIIESETITTLNTMGSIDERVFKTLSVPFRRIYPHPGSNYKLKIADDGSFNDEWMVGYVPKGPYNERVQHPLSEASINDLSDFSWPDPSDTQRVSDLRKRALNFIENTGCSLVAGHISAGLFQDCWNLRGMARFLEDMALRPEFAQALLDRVLFFHLTLWERILDEIGDLVDIVETADDLAGQKGLLISPQMFRDLIKPRQAALNATIREKTRAKIFYHSCGAVIPLVEDLIEVGVDILNPIQPLEGLMDVEQLSDQFGRKLIFHGGLDVQHLLPSASIEEINTQVRRNYRVLGKAGYIMAPANTIPPGTPPENILAAYETANSI